MEVKAVLQKAWRSNARLEALMERRKRYAQLHACHSAGRVKALETLQRELDRRIEETAGLALEAEKHIKTVKDPCQQEVLRYRYLDGRDWQDIARQMNLSRDWVKHVHTRALRELEGK